MHQIKIQIRDSKILKRNPHIIFNFIKGIHSTVELRSQENILPLQWNIECFAQCFPNFNLVPIKMCTVYMTVTNRQGSSHSFNAEVTTTLPCSKSNGRDFGSCVQHKVTSYYPSFPFHFFNLVSTNKDSTTQKPRNQNLKDATTQSKSNNITSRNWRDCKIQNLRNGYGESNKNPWIN